MTNIEKILDGLTADESISDSTTNKLLQLEQAMIEKNENIKPMVICAFKDGFSQSASWLTPVGSWYVTETKQDLESFLDCTICDKDFEATQ